MNDFNSVQLGNQIIMNSPKLVSRVPSKGLLTSLHCSKNTSKVKQMLKIPFSESFFLLGERAKFDCRVEKSLLVEILETSSAIPVVILAVNTPSVCCRFLCVCSIFPVVFQTTGRPAAESANQPNQTVRRKFLSQPEQSKYPILLWGVLKQLFFSSWTSLFFLDT